jgi:hypothetical protein
MPISINPGSLVIDLHPRQMEVLKCPANEIFWGGSCGGGKSFLARALAIILCLELPEFSAFLFRRTFREIIDVHMKGPGSFPALLAGLENDGVCRVSRTEIKFFNGSSIKLCHLENPASDVFSYQGSAFQLLILDEATHIPGEAYCYLRTRLRLGGLRIPDGSRWKNRLPISLLTSNPGGPNHHYYKENFVDLGEFKVVQMSEQDGAMKRVFIPAKLEDNPDMLRNDPGYEAKLFAVGDRATAMALRHGDWSVVSGSMFAEAWDKSKHVINPFAIPYSWGHPTMGRIWRGADDGFAAPAAVVWMTRDPVHDRYYVINELYKAKMLPEEFANRVLDADRRIPVRCPDGTEGENDRTVKGVLDSSAFADTGTGSIARGHQMRRLNCQWDPADKGAHSRVQGVQNIHRMLALQDDGMPKLQIFNNCVTLIKALPSAPRSATGPEDIDGSFELDHILDALRYALPGDRAGFKRVRWGGI